MNQIDISVIIPIYEVETYIEKCLLSLFNQTKTSNVEFILIDDCGKDNSMFIANTLTSIYSHLNIKIVKHSCNKGVGQSRKTGIAYAKGKYSIQIDSDDWCERNLLETLFEKAERDGADIVVCDFDWEYPNKTTYSREYMPNNNIECVNRLLLGENFTSLWNKLFRHSLFTENNITCDCSVSYGEDALLCFKAFFFAKKISYVNSSLVHYRQNAKSISHNNNKLVHQGLYVVLDIISFFDKYGELENVSNGIKRQKLFCKMTGISKSPRGSQRQFVNIFPEVNKDILTTNYSFVYRILIYLAANGWLLPFNTYRTFRELFSNLFTKQKI